MSRKYKVGFFVQRVAGALGFENNVSAHVQVPARSMCLLLEAGFEVELVTTEYGSDRSLPHCLPKGISVHTVPYGLSQGKDLVMYSGRKRGLRPAKLVSQVKGLKKLAEEREFDIYHLSGGEGIASLGGLCVAAGSRIPIIASLNTGNIGNRSNLFKKLLWRKLAKVITSTAYFHQKCESAGLDVMTIRHGAVKDVGATHLALSERRRVLFWRDPSRENGADLCVEAFRRLAQRYPRYSFDFAVRPHWDRVGGMEELAREHKNVNCFQFPYQNAATIEEMIEQSLCIVLPFRELSINPQLAVMESILSGVATLTTDVESNRELVDHMRTGMLIKSNDVDAIVSGVEYLLSNPGEADRIGKRGREDVMAAWNWNSYGEELIGVYEQVLAKSGRLQSSGA